MYVDLMIVSKLRNVFFHQKPTRQYNLLHGNRSEMGGFSVSSEVNSACCSPLH